MKKLSCNKLCEICDKITLVLLCILMADCAVLGSGRAITVGPLGLRMVWFGLLMVASVPLIVRQFPRLIKIRILWVLAAFALWLIIEAIVGIYKGNSRSMLASDIKGFAYFIAVLPALCVLNSKQRIHTLMKVVMYANAFLALASFILLLMYNDAPKLFNKLADWDIDHHLTMFSAASSRVPRMFFKSTPYFLTTCAFPVYFAVVEKKAVRFWLYPLIVGLSLYGLLISYTRSVYLAAAVSVLLMLPVFFLVLGKDGKKRFAATVSISLVTGLLLVGTCSALYKENYFSYAFDRVGLTFQHDENQAATKPSTDTTPEATNPPETDATENPQDELNQHFENDTLESDKIRDDTTAELNQHIRSSPLWGHGLGKALEVRDGKANEYIYQDIWMKTGIIGLLLFLAPAGMLLVKQIMLLRKKSENTVLCVTWLAILLGFMAFSYFNPYMNAALGVLFYCCTIGVFCACDKENN